jgi:hypothetical protein
MIQKLSVLLFISILVPIASYAGPTALKSIRVNGEFVATLSVDSSGATDAGRAINNAISQAGISGNVQLECGAKYLISTPINLSGRNGFTFQGCQGTVRTGPGGTAALICNTGSNPCIDETASQGVTLSDIELDSSDNSPTHPSQIAVLQAPSTSSEIAQQEKMNRVFINLKTAGGEVHKGKGSIGIYNYGAEITSYNDVVVQADTPVVLSSTNTIGITSPNQTIASGPRSMSQVKFTAASGLVTINGPGGVSVGPRIWCDGLCSDVDLGSTYMLASGTRGTTPPAILGGDWQRIRWEAGRQEYNQTGGTVPFLIELAAGGQLSDSLIVGILDDVGNQGVIQMDDGGAICPGIVGTKLLVRNDNASSDNNFFKESGTGCKGAQINNSSITLLAGNNKVALAQGGPDTALELDGNIALANVSLPAGSEFWIKNGTAGGAIPGLQLVNSPLFLGNTIILCHGTPTVSGGGVLAIGSNGFAGAVSNIATADNVLTPGCRCPNSVVPILFDSAGSTVSVAATSATSVTFSGTFGHNIQYLVSCR